MNIERSLSRKATDSGGFVTQKSLAPGTGAPLPSAGLSTQKSLAPGTGTLLPSAKSLGPNSGKKLDQVGHVEPIPVTDEKPVEKVASFNINDVITLSRPDRTLTQRRQAAMYFAHISTDPVLQQKIVDMKRNYGIEPLISLLQSNDAVCQRFTALAIGNIASNSYCRIKLVEGNCLKELFTVSVTDEFEISARRYSVFAIGNIAASNNTHESFIEYIPIIIDLLDNADIELCRYTTQILQNLAANVPMLVHLIKGGMV